MKKLTFVGLASLVTGMLLLVAPSVAWAHRPQLSGTTACPGADHVITWSIGNDLKKPMSIMSADAVLNGTTYAVTGYTSPVLKGIPTSATTTIDGTLTGTVTLTVVGHWPDGVENPKSVDVTLDTPCTPTTTTTPTTEPSTTPTTVTTTPPPTTKPNGGTDIELTPPTTTCVPTAANNGCKLAYTAGATHLSAEKALGVGTVFAGVVFLLCAGSSANRRRRLLGR